MIEGSITKWGPESFELETNTVWSFPERGNWATHDGKYRGNWSPYIPRNIILRYSKSGDYVLDQFVGGGTTLVEAKLLNRNAIGVDVNGNALKRCIEKLDFEFTSGSRIFIKRGDARKLDFIKDNSIDLICTHPPYADIIRYSENIEEDISRYEEKRFLEEMMFVANESIRVLKSNKYCVILIGDMRKKGNVIPLGFEVMQLFVDAGFALKEIVIKKQYNCMMTKEWREISKNRNFLLLVHEYVIVFKK